jgi:hypothetical protein
VVLNEKLRGKVRMTEESPAKRGDAAWKEEREAISKRNAEAHKRAQGEQRSRDASVAANQREAVDREAKQLHELNERIAKGRAGGSR